MRPGEARSPKDTSVVSMWPGGGGVLKSSKFYNYNKLIEKSIVKSKLILVAVQIVQ